DVEIKARFENHDKVRKILLERGARFAGVDTQVDVYFKVNTGRLKLRKGTIEKALVFYSRENIKGIKPSEFKLYKSANPDELEFILRSSLGVLVEVEKTREMYYIENIKFNIDTVKELGKFVEIEAMTEDRSEISNLQRKVESFIELFGINKEDLQSHSYSDLLMVKK
ncbi:MAG: class IV adenylate cyclase, partial [Asgard group archaeon]|nr:class IV adenylate cyclase [Asgard group archaeon]